MTREELLKAIRSRASDGRYGIGTADTYLKAVAGCLSGGYCPRSLQGVTQAEWAGAIKDAEQKFVYSQSGMNVKGVFEASDPSYQLEFDCVVTSTKKDRDGDVLETRGAILDEFAPLLWQHNSFLPLGKVLRRTGQTTSKLTARCCILNFGDGDGELAQLARDAAVLVKANALRISHGFDPRDFSALDEKDGRYLISSFEILEVSLVSIPSNTDAVITAFSNHKLHSTIIKSWAEKMYQERPVVVQGANLRSSKVKEAVALLAEAIEPESKSHDCHCGGTCDECRKDAAAHPHGSVRREGESMQDCVSRKIEILMNEGGRSREQCQAIAYSMCGEKAMRDLGISEKKDGDGQLITLDEVRLRAAEKSDPIRWNKSLSKRFDVANEPVKPSSMGYEWAAKFLEVPVKHIFDTGVFIPSARMGSWLTAFRQVSADFDTIDIRNIHGNHESPPVYETIQLKSNLAESFLVEGTQFYVVGSKNPLIVSFEPQWGGIQVRMYCRNKERQMAVELIDKSWQIAKENNFLKGEAFSLSGEFIPRDSTNWSDIFLTEKNQKALVRTINNLNSKGRSCPNRGIIMMGPPGTGKTLSGRVIKNLAQATFIWISARDFHRSGSFGGFEYAFDMAKELSPCVLFFEDIDNWIGPQTVDLMKTEMDGLTKSSGIVTIMTTNFPESLPEALIDRPGRFHDILKIDLPNDQVRKQMISKWVSGITGQQIQAAVERTKGYSGAHIYELSQFAKAIMETDELPISEALTKALDKIDEQRDMISRNLLQGSRYQPRKDIAMIEKNSTIPLSSGGAPGMESRTDDDRENFLGQGPSQGDRDWNERHLSARITDQQMPGVSDFNVGNTADDSIMAVAAGSMSGPQQLPAPDTVLSSNEGPKGQPGVPTPTMGIQTPISMPVVLNVSTSPGPQGSRSEPSLSASVQGPKDATPTIKEQSVNDARQVTPMDRDSADQHDTAGNIDTHVIVDVPHLKRVANMIQHSGKEGNSYLHPEQGHVHHVAHPDDLHPSNEHMYHGHDEIHKLYKSVRGVKSVKVAIQQHPMKGMGYTLVHKHDRVPGADPGMGDGTEHVSTHPVLKAMLNLKGRIEYLFHGKAKSAEESKKILADGYVLLMQLIKDYSGLNPGGGAQATLPSNNELNQHSLGNFSGVPGNNSLNQSSLSGWQGGSQPSMGTPTNNAQNVESATGFGQAQQPNTPASNPPYVATGKSATAVIQNEHVNGMGGPRENVLANPTPESRRTDPGTMSNESVDGPNIPGSLAFRGNVLNEDNLMDWLEDSAPALVGEDAKEFDEMFTKHVKEFEAEEFDKMFSA